MTRVPTRNNRLTKRKRRKSQITTVVLSQSTSRNSPRTFSANETGTVSGGGWTSPTHDAAGNMASSPVPQDETVSQGYVFDAWNRLLEVRDNTNTLIFSFEYDGLARRMSRYNAVDSTPTTHLYYQDLQGRLIEIARAGTSRYFDHYVYGLDGHIPLVRYRDTDANGSMDETQHYTWDANGNITSMLGLNGSVVERYTYEAYGRPSFWSGSWASRPGPAQGNRILFGAAYFQDRNTDLYFANARYYHSTLGRFISRDPLADAYQDGPNLYQYVRSMPTRGIDPSGRGFILPGPTPGDGVWSPPIGDPYWDRRPLGGGPTPRERLGTPRNSLDIDTDGVHTGDHAKRLLGPHAFGAAELRSIIEECCNGEGGKLKLTHLRLWGHGSPGQISLGPMGLWNIGGATVQYDATFLLWKQGFSQKGTTRETRFLDFLAEYMADGSILEFATCQSGKGESGKQLQAELEQYFRERGLSVHVKLYEHYVTPVLGGVRVTEDAGGKIKVTR